MQSRRLNASKSPVVVSPPDKEKLEMIRTGKKKKTISGVKENKNIKLIQDGSKVIAVEKEKKVEEEGVTRKKRNYVMYESKIGTEKETDYTKIAAKKLRAPKPRVEERIVQQRKRREYLDNYQYHETKSFRSPNPRPALVIHQRLGEKIGGSYEEISYEKYRTIQSPQPRQSDALRAKQSTYTRNQRTSSPQNKGYNISTQNRQTPNRPGSRRSNSRGGQTNKSYNIRTAPRNSKNIEPRTPEGATEYTTEHTKLVTKDGQTTKTTRTKVTSGRRK